MPKLPKAGSEPKTLLDNPPPGHLEQAEKKMDEAFLPVDPAVPVPDEPETPARRTAKKAASPAPEAPSPASDADFGFLPLDEAEDVLNVLWYGREGTGKTTDAAMMANLEGATRVLIVNSEGGLKKPALRKRGVDTSKIVLWPTPGDPITFEGLESLFYKIQGDLEENPHAWTGVVFDSLTEIHKVLLENIVAGAVAKAAKSNKERDRFFIDRGDYGVMSSQVNLLIRRFRDLQCHFGVTCLERRDQDDDTGKIFYGPQLTPALQTDVLGYVDLVLQTRGEEFQTAEGPVTEFSALTRPQGRVRAKDRFDATPRVLIDPDFLRVHAYVTGSMTEETDPAQADAAEYRQQAAALEAAKEAEKQARRQGGAARKTAAPAA